MNRTTIIEAEYPPRPPGRRVQARLSRKAESNPLVTAMLRSRKGKRATVVLDKTGLEALTPAARQSLARWFFGDEAICEVGSFFLVAFLTNDRTVEKATREAFRAANHIFRRDRERELLKQALDCMIEIGERGDNPEKLKKALEARRHGQMLPQHRWSELRKALGLPNRATGAAAHNYPRKRKSRRSG
jgi:hypothetical protein